MKKIMIAVFAVMCGGAAYAGTAASQLGLDRISAEGSNVIVPEATPASKAGTSQILVDRFNDVEFSLKTMDSNLGGVAAEIGKLDLIAKEIIKSGVPDPAFADDLKRMAGDMSRHVKGIVTISNSITLLATEAEKSKELNKISNYMTWPARSIVRKSSTEISTAAKNLQATVRSGKPELLGSDVQKNAESIVKDVAELNTGANNIVFDVKALVRVTNPF